MKRIYSLIVPIALAALALSSCSDYDNGYTENELTHIKGFEDAFGKIDSEQDWNLAERNTVEVTVGSTSTVQIFALVNGAYSLVGEYSGVTGTQELGFDVVEGTEKIIVSDGKTAISTTMGGVADFTVETRAANVGTTYDVTVATGGYIEFNKAKAKAYDTTLPEINDDSKSYGETNLGKVTQNFKYVSNGKFSFYPVFWDTNGSDAIYVYYTDASGNYREVLVYTPKSGDELQNLFEQDYGICSNPYDDINKAGTTEQLCLQYVKKKSSVSNFTYDAASGVYTWTENSVNYIYHAGEGNYTAPTWANDEIVTYASFKVNTVQNVFSAVSTAAYDGNPAAVTQRSKEITIDIPAGTTFGFMLKNGSYSFYSESAKNHVYGDRFTTSYQNEHACYAASVVIGGEQYLCFEDWYKGDYDLNDVVFKFDGNIPTVVDEDHTAATWILACEDLGGTFDADYNDVVIKVEHVSGQTTATVTPLAAGGTLASYLFFINPDTGSETSLGEIHQLFGQEASVSGNYIPHNVSGSRGTAGTSKTITVDKDWTMAYYTTDNYSTSSQYSGYNMGGFTIYVLEEGTAAPTGTVTTSTSGFGSASIVAAPNAGKVPEMLCIPYTYAIYTSTTKTEYVWALPRELKTIAVGQGAAGEGTGAYNNFAGWVTNHNNNTDWYKYPNTTYTVSELKTVTELVVEETPQEVTIEGTQLPVRNNQSFTYTDKYGNTTTYSNAAFIDFSSITDSNAPDGYTATINVIFESIPGCTIYWDAANGEQLVEDYGGGYKISTSIALTAEQLHKAKKTGGIYIVGAENKSVNLAQAAIVLQYGASQTFVDDDDNGNNNDDDDNGNASIVAEKTYRFIVAGGNNATVGDALTCYYNDSNSTNELHYKPDNQSANQKWVLHQWTDWNIAEGSFIFIQKEGANGAPLVSSSADGWNASFEWNVKGDRVSFKIEDAGDGSYYIYSVADAGYLGCDYGSTKIYLNKSKAVAIRWNVIEVTGSAKKRTARH